MNNTLLRCRPKSGYSECIFLCITEDKPNIQRKEDHALSWQLLIASSLTASSADKPVSKVLCLVLKIKKLKKIYK